MEQSIVQSPDSNLPWLIRRQGRVTAAIAAAAVAYLLTRSLPDELGLLIPYDLGVTAHLALFYALVARTSPEEAAELSRRREPNNVLILLAVILLSVVSLAGVAAMLNHPAGRPRWVVDLHMAASLLAVILSWLIAHIYFGLHYMRIYYDDAIVDGKLTYHKGLSFPQRETVGFHDFIYYALTIGMCYSTADVAVTSEKMRRVTLLHAIFSFVYVTVVIGFVVNIIQNVV